jgi:hypothetical protein
MFARWGERAGLTLTINAGVDISVPRTSALRLPWEGHSPELAGLLDLLHRQTNGVWFK